jgi:hypothetical protein
MGYIRSSEIYLTHRVANLEPDLQSLSQRKKFPDSLTVGILPGTSADTSRENVV